MTSAARLVRDEPGSVVVEVLCREVGSEIGAVAVDRAVLHQPVALKLVHARDHVGAREQRLAALVDDAAGNRRLARVGKVGQHAENRESDEIRQDGDLQPQRRHWHPLPRVAHEQRASLMLSLVEREAAAINSCARVRVPGKRAGAIEFSTVAERTFDSFTPPAEAAVRDRAHGTSGVGARFAFDRLTPSIMAPSTRTQQWIELAAGSTRAEFARRHPGYFLVCSSIDAGPAREVRWIRPRAGAATAGEARVTIGRGARCDLPLVHPSIASRHAALVLDDAGRPIAVSDLGSANGTRINGQPLPPNARRELDQRDQLQLGSVAAAIVEAARAYDLLRELAQQLTRPLG